MTCLFVCSSLFVESSIYFYTDYAVENNFFKISGRLCHLTHIAGTLLSKCLCIILIYIYANYSVLIYSVIDCIILFINY